MAKMIPDIPLETIENRGERTFYELARKLPDEYTVFYSYKFALEDDASDPYNLREADFIIAHEHYGFAVIEVKEGTLTYNNGLWYSSQDGKAYPFDKDPVEQARNAMFAIVNRYRNKYKERYPLQCQFALCFPDSTKTDGFLPADLNENQIWTFKSIEYLEESFLSLFNGKNKKLSRKSHQKLIEVLSPTFRIFANLNDEIDLLNKKAEIILTEEQERILEETEEDLRKIFLGAAGTGKTFIAMKKANDLAYQGKKVFLTCFNKQLVNVFKAHCTHENIHIANFHDFLEKTIKKHDIYIETSKGEVALDQYFEVILPEKVFDLYSFKDESEKFDAIIVDEGQDFSEFWYICLNEMVKQDGHFYIFADRNQNLFGDGLENLNGFEISKHKLTVNLRNTEKINEWSRPFLESKRIKYKIKGGQPVENFLCKDDEEEKRKLEKEIESLVSKGLNPNRITILSPYKKENSSLKDVNFIGFGEWKIYDLTKGRQDGIAFSTIRAFKGLESDVVLLIGVRKFSKVCTPADIYVGGTRARFILKIFHRKGWSVDEMLKEYKQ